MNLHCCEASLAGQASAITPEQRWASPPISNCLPQHAAQGSTSHEGVTPGTKAPLCHHKYHWLRLLFGKPHSWAHWQLSLFHCYITPPLWPFTLNITENRNICLVSLSACVMAVIMVVKACYCVVSVRRRAKKRQKQKLPRNTETKAPHFPHTCTNTNNKINHASVQYFLWFNRAVWLRGQRLQTTVTEVAKLT